MNLVLISYILSGFVKNAETLCDFLNTAEGMLATEI